jgi:hypothetical protein
MKKLIGVVTMGVVLGSAAAFADPDPSRQPLDRAIERVGENIAEHPDNEGLQNAINHLLDNRARQAARGKNQAPGQQKREPSSAEHKEIGGDVERPQVVDRAESIDRPETAARPDVSARPELSLSRGRPRR